MVKLQYIVYSYQYDNNKRLDISIKIFNNCLEFILNSRGVLKTNLVFESTKKENSMSNLNGTKTHENLKAAFAGESQANRRYLYFAKVADIEGYPEIASNFRETAEGETGHAHGHLDYLKEVGDPATGLPIGETLDNLKAAVAGETHEYTDMYPGMAKTAREDGFAEIADWFETLAKAEKSHAGRFQQMADSVS
jgi:rubrerythrin|tara:strand:- start:43 stop:624 length:582 start_codon:yes stop_codon:yes gene_type:complete